MNNIQSLSKQDSQGINKVIVQEAVYSSLQRIKMHPFIVAADKENLGREESLRWIKCAGRESRTFPIILENMLSYCDHPVIRCILQSNLDDEYGNGNPEHAHYNHYLHLLDKLDIPRNDFEEYQEKAGVKLAIELAVAISNSGNLPRALGYMIVNEGMTPITYSAVQKGLMKYFPSLKTMFFDMHIAVDEQHICDLYEAIAELPCSTLEEVLFGISVGERGMAVLLDEVIGVFPS